jgi:DNA-binding NtrC family response regulator
VTAATVPNAQAHSPAADLAFSLVVIEGPDRGRQHALTSRDPTRVLLGTSSACELKLTDGGVSRRHAAVWVENGRVRINDLDSTNGTFVDSVPVVDAWVQPGHAIRVGATTLRLESAASVPAATAASDATGFGPLKGASLEMRRIYPLCERLAASNVPVLIEGETGTGKEVLAEALHQKGGRAAGPFIVFDCTAVAPSLVESELFGHERGAFTGATSMRKGVFEQAHGGTLLIDEIGDLELALQPKLLRALERSEVRRVGGTASIKVDVRILCATRRDLDHEVQAGRFRDDLFHRLAVGRVELPPLRRRGGDVALLARHFWAALGGDPAALADAQLVRWADYAWPGNVRELRNATARRLALGELAAETNAKPPAPSEDFIGAVLDQNLPLPMARRAVAGELERRYVEKVLAAHGGNVGKAAEASGIARRYFQIIRSRQR